jgi:hypothetical protein
MTEQTDWIESTTDQPEPKPERPSYAIGAHANISNEDYHRSEGISSTSLKRILRSPAHYRYPKPYDSTRAKEIGSAIHCATLEPGRFQHDYRIVECDARTSPLYKAACKDHPKERVLTSAEHENVQGMQKGVMRNRGCRELIEAPGRYELSVFAKDPETGLIVKVRYDKLLDCGMPLDLKKTQDARPDAFSRAIQNYQYHLSAAFYQDVWSWAFAEELQPMRWIAVEEQRPHAAERYKIDEDTLMIGRAMYREALVTYAKCLDADEWPAYSGGEEMEIGVPGWAISNYEDSLEVMLDER